MPRKIEQRATASTDVDLLWDYIAFGNPTSGDPRAADRVIDAIRRTYDLLAEFPHKTQIAKIAGRDLFKTTVKGFKQYLIIYRFDDETVEVLRVIRADLDWTRIIAEI